MLCPDVVMLCPGSCTGTTTISKDKHFHEQALPSSPCRKAPSSAYQVATKLECDCLGSRGLSSILPKQEQDKCVWSKRLHDGVATHAGMLCTVDWPR